MFEISRIYHRSIVCFFWAILSDTQSETSLLKFKKNICSHTQTHTVFIMLEGVWDNGKILGSVVRPIFKSYFQQWNIYTFWEFA